MSEPVMQRLKISREGIILIKSFEGFRPHAMRRDDGRWVIGYGHTLSAREGGIVSEADAELLLQYDLLPVATALNDTAGPLNQHQFDALASFAFSVGLDRFQTSDVLARLTSGSAGEAADAIVGWTEPQPTDTPLRRRAAERALFVADPNRPVALAELLSAPLPPPQIVVPAFTGTPEADASETVENTVEPAESETGAGPVLEPVSAVTPKGEVAVVPELSSSLRPFAAAETAPTEPVAETETDVEPGEVVEAPESVLSDEPTLAQDDASAEASDDADVTEQEAPRPLLESGFPDDAVTTEATTQVDPFAPVPASNDALKTTGGPLEAYRPTQIHAPIHRYAAYSATVIGPLPGTPAASWPATQSEVLKSTEAALTDAVAAPLDEAPTAGFPTTAFPITAAPAELPVINAPENLAEPALFQASISADALAADGGELLVLTPLDETSIFPTQRLVWPHAEPAADQTPPLFDDDGALRLGAHQMIRNEIVGEEPRRLDWRETGLYILMGGFGLLTFGMSMAAFRRASAPSGGSDFMTVAWILAVFGFACIAVSAWNLYRKLGRPED